MKNKEDLMSFEKFKAIMSTLIAFKEQKDRISDFFEKEIMSDSWCIITLGNEVESTLVNLLADEFECWYSFHEKPEVYDWWDFSNKYRGFENDIENWLYSMDDIKKVYLNKEEIDVTSIESLYEFLIKQYKLIHSEENLTEA